MTGPSTRFFIRSIDPTTDPAWQSLLEQCPAARLFHAQPWIRAVAEGYGFDIRAYVAETASGVPAAAAAYCEIDDFAGHRIVSVPFADACDPLVSSVEAWPELLAALQSHQLPVNLRCLKDSSIRHFDIVKKARWHRLPIQAPIEELWRAVSPEARRAIRQSERTPVELRPLQGDRDRAEFHRLHVALRKEKYKLLAQPPRFFEALERRFRETGAWHSLGAYLGSRMIAGTIYLRWGDTLYYKFNASAPDALHTRPNNRLAWEGVRLAKSLGCHYLDFGPSDIYQPGLIRFKRAFGAQDTELQFLRWTPNGWHEPPERRAILAEVTRAMTDPAVSDDLAGQVGAAFYRFFA